MYYDKFYLSKEILMHRFSARFLFALAVLSGCSALVPSGVAQLASLSPLDADPAGIEVALVLPDGIDVAPGSAKLNLSATREDTGETEAAEFILAAKAGDPAGFDPDAALVRRFHIADADIARMRAMQDNIRHWKEVDGAKTTGSLSVALGGCTLGNGPAPDARASVYLRASEEGGFFPVLANARIADLGDTQTPSPCPSNTDNRPDGAH
jgi:hypothetical protein